MNSNSKSITDSLALIEEGLKNISSNDEWMRFLGFTAKFHNYSLSNCLLLYLQMPSATFVAGYNKWKQLDRYVKKGEKSLQILAPCTYKIDRDNDDPEYVVKSFKFVSVFDLSQTYGDDKKLPVLIGGLHNHITNEDEIYNNLINKFSLPVDEIYNLPANGCYYTNEQKIAIKSTLSPLHKIKTLLHEYAHHLHHVKYFNNECKDLAEVLAESTAFVICSYLGIDTLDYSIPYIKTWCKDEAMLKDSFLKIKQISSDIINLIEEPTDFTEPCIAV